MLSPVDVLKINKTEIITKHDCIITINYDEYDDDVTELKSFYIVPGTIEIYFPSKDDFTQIITPYSDLYVVKSNDYDDDDKNITLNYKENDVIVSQKYTDNNMAFGNIKKIVEGKLLYIKTPEALLNIFHVFIPSIDLCHLELLISNMLRDKDGNLCRHSGNFKDFDQIGIMNQAKSDSWLSSIAFQNIDQAINKALINKEDAKMNPLEKILNQEFNF